MKVDKYDKVKHGEYILDCFRDKKEERFNLASFLIWVGLILVVIFALCGGCKKAYAYTNTEIVNAIYKAEGGSKATYAYGIRSVSYDSIEEARRICFNTVRNNRKRFAKQTKHTDYLTFLASRYCPVNCDNDTGTNKYWIKNVRYFLAEGGDNV